MGPEVQIVFVISWVLTLKFLQASLWPALERTLGGAGYPLAFSGGFLLFTLFSWYSGAVGLPLVLSLLPFVALFALHLKRGSYTAASLKRGWRWDALFLAGFLFMLAVRFVNPTISFAEKFMDHAFIASIMRTPVVPPLDPWFAGGTLDVYYYLGYWMMGAFGLVSGVPSTVVFNLALPTVLGLTLVSGGLVGTTLLSRWRGLPLLTFFLVNPSFLLLLVQGTDLPTVMWNSTRTIPGTINEFPLFSLLWGDVHPHLVGMFNQVFFLALLSVTASRWSGLDTRGRAVLIGLSALSLGAMPLINTWDVLVYGPLAVVVGVWLWYRHRGETHTRIPAATYAVLVPLLGILLYLPYYRELSAAGILGVGVVPTPSDTLPFFLVSGFFLLILTVLYYREALHRPYLLLIPLGVGLAGYGGAALALVPLVLILSGRRFEFPEILALAGLVVLLVPEFLYLADAFSGTYFRMNTVFKLGFAAWILLGMASFTLLSRRLPHPPRLRISSRPIAALILLLAGVLVISPLALHLDYGQPGGTLDGLAYLRSTHPGDAEAVTFLRNLPGDHALVEAENGAYTYYSRISAFTGIPALIGRPSHELVWRGEEAGAWQRASDVRAIYEDPARTISLMRSYGVDLLYVGESERERYTVRLPASGLMPIYDRDDVTIYRLADADVSLS